MPVYDAVLGARSDMTKVPVADRPRADELFERAQTGDDLSASDREHILDELAQIAGVHAALAMESEDGGRYLHVLAGGQQQRHELQDSRARDRLVAPRGRFAPTLRTRSADLVDDALELLREVSADDVHDGGDGRFELPFHWSDRDAMLAALARLVPLLRGKGFAALVEIDDVRYDVEATKELVTCHPLYLVGAHADMFCELAGLAPPEPAVTVPVAAPVRAKRAPAWDPARPYTTGTAQQRDVAWNTATDYGHRSVADLAPMIDALRDPANHERRYGELRRSIYHYLAKRDVEEVHAAFLWALREEDDELAETVTYIGWRLDGLIARLPDHLREAEARGDTRTAARMRRLLAQAG